MTRRTVHVFLVAWAIVLGIVGLITGAIFAIRAVTEWNEAAGTALGIVAICTAFAAMLTAAIRDIEKGRNR